MAKVTTTFTINILWIFGAPSSGTTKWFLLACEKLGIASHLKRFPENEIQKGELTMQLEKTRAIADALERPTTATELPEFSWNDFQKEAGVRPLVLIAGFIHDVSAFLDEHPGGRRILENNIGRDSTGLFFGGAYAHSNAAQNVSTCSRTNDLLYK